MTTALIIMDGFGISRKVKGNAIKAANTPTFNRLIKEYPYTTIEASELAVGLPKGQMGNSEVGHLNIGAGRVVYQDITAIDKAIEDKTFFKNEAFLGAIENCKRQGSSLHIAGLLSTGGVHSSLDHLFALLDLAKKHGLKNVYIHAIMDGRDVSPTSGIGFIKQTEDKLKEIKIGKIATVVGRFYYMDRDNRWDRVEKAYRMIAYAEGERYGAASAAVGLSYEAGVTDEFITPKVIGDYPGLDANDSYIFFNFRSDRAREMTRVLTQKDFNAFDRRIYDLYYVCMTQYDASFNGIHIAFPPREIKNTLAEYISKLGYTQTHTAETEKYAHVTFFLNGGKEEPYPREKRILVQSPKVATYDLKPEMSAYEVKDKCLEEIDKGVDFLIVNFANCDMVGHTGVFGAAVKAVETVDDCLGQVLDKLKQKKGQAIIIADHGNADQMLMPDGSPCTSHSLNVVPFIVFSEKFKNAKLKSGGALCDVAPTLLHIADIDSPKEMTGKCLIQ